MEKDLKLLEFISREIIIRGEGMVYDGLNEIFQLNGLNVFLAKE